MSEIHVLCCAECDTPVVTTEGRGSYCLHCGYAPSMQDTHFRPARTGNEDQATRIDYVCSECGVHTVKLWREIHSGKVLRCVECACKHVGIDAQKVTPEGKYDNEETGWCDQLYSSKTGRNLLPAVPDDTWTTFWGYTSVPPDGCAWWRYLPLRRGS